MKPTLADTAVPLILTLFLLASTADVAGAQALPPIKASADNPVPQCATPGRLMAYLQSRNPRLDPRFAGIAAHYMRHGEELSLRWDVAFFQMIVDTRSLEFRRGNGEPSTVRPAQNNFAGIGASGGSNHGESFADISTGVRAHLQHVQIYAGERVASPIAERTRKVQDWGVLVAWQKSLTGPVTFTDLTRNWSPGDRSYAASIDSVGRRFYEGFCNIPDPAPQLVAQAHGSRGVAAPRVANGPPSIGANLAQQAIERSRAEGEATRSSLGALIESLEPAPARAPAPVQPPTQAPAPSVAARPAAKPFRVLNAQPMPAVEIEALPPPMPTEQPLHRQAALDVAAAHRPDVAAGTPPAAPVQVAASAAKLDSDRADETIKALVTGKTFLLDTPIGSVIPIAFRADGTMTGRADATLAGMLGAEKDSGKWWVERTRLCQRWRVWFDKEDQCLKLRQKGATIHWVRDDGKTGTARLSTK